MAEVMHAPTAELDDAAVALADAIAKAEVAVVACVLPDTRALMPVAEAQGVTPDTFSHADVRLLWCAADVARDRPLIDVLKLARAALRREHYWDPRGPIGTGCMWSDETLVRLTQLYPASPVATRYYARNLVTLHRRWTMAENLLAQFRAALLGDDEPIGPLPLRSRAPAVTVIRRKGGAA
jgi:hypothetical protein